MPEASILDLIAEAVEVDKERLTPDTQIQDVEEWTSLAWLTLIALADERLSIQIPARQIRSFKTVQDVVQYITVQVRNG